MRGKGKKIIMFEPELPFNPIDAESEIKASEFEEQKIKRDFNSPIPVFYIVASIAVVLLVIMSILGARVFHFW
jgi:hypothetical protein